MREHYLPILSSSIRLNQPSGGHSFTLWNITFSPSLRYHGIRYKKIFLWLPVFDPPPCRTLRVTALIDFHFSYVLSAEKEINIPWSASSTYMLLMGISWLNPCELYHSVFRDCCNLDHDSLCPITYRICCLLLQSLSLITRSCSTDQRNMHK